MEVQDANANNDERAALEVEINALTSELNGTKKKIFKLYERNRSSSVFKNYTAADFDINRDKTLLPVKVSPKDKAKIFFRKYLNVKLKNKNNLIVVYFPRFSKQTYALFFKSKKKEIFILDKCYLPQTFNMRNEKENRYPLTLYEIPRYVLIVLENINAFSIRQMQFEQLKKVADKRIMMFHTNCFMEITFQFNVLNIKTNARKSTNVQLIYPILHMLPTIINISVSNDASLEKFLEENFSQFTENFLVAAYDLAFVNSEIYKFFV